MIAFIEKHRDTFGVEPICRSLPIAPSTFYARLAVVRDPARASPRAKSDARHREDIARIWGNNRNLYGVRKVWHALRRENVTIARCSIPAQFS